MTEEKMSSEVEEKQVTAEDATNTEEKNPAEVESSKPEFSPEAIAAISKQREAKQQALVDAAELRGKVSAMQESQAKQAPPTVSPLDADIARQKAEGVADEDMQISPAVIRADKLYERQIANQETEHASALALANQQAVSLKASKIVHEDWQEVVDAGEKLLSRGETLDVTSVGADFGEIAYAKCKAAIERNKPVKTTETAPETKLSEQEIKDKKAAEEKKKAEEAPSQDEVLANASPAAAAAFKL